MADELHLDIDEFRLEKEWVGQPKLYHEWAQRLADANQELDLAKRTLEVIRASIDQEVRLSPGEFNISKITENAVEAAVTLDPRYEKAQSDVISAKHRVDTYKAAVVSLDQRKTALEYLVRLHLASYYAEPRAPEQGVDHMERVAVARDAVQALNDE